MRALVTGAFGFAGLHLLRRLADCGDEILAASLENPPAALGCPTAHIDVTSLDSCVRCVNEFKPEVIYHLAGLAFAPDADRDFNNALIVNTGGTFNILKASGDSGLNPKVIVISSSEVYGLIGAERMPLTEDLPVSPNNSYGLSKATVELVAKRFERNLRVVTVRAFNHIGPGQRPDFVVSSFAKQLADIKLGKSAPVIRVGNLDAKRDFTDVRDIVRGYRLAAERGEGIINLCSGRAAAVQEILDTLIDLSGLKVSVERDPARMRPAEMPIVVGSYAKAKKTLGWEPEIPLERSLKDALDYWTAAGSA